MKIIVLGIGGVGSEIVSELERETDERKKESTRFVIMDTDVNTIARLKREGFSGGVVTMSDRMTIRDYLEVNEEAKKWFFENPILLWKPVTEGAGQVRSVSRLAFEIASKEDDKLAPLYNAIRELHISVDNEADTENSAFRIIIVSTLAGGTGSGAVLPIALHLRKYMESVYKRKDVIIRGVFLMADCMEKVVHGTSEIKSLRGNTYAAIKELNAFMKQADGYLDSRYDGIRLNQKQNAYMADKRKNMISYNFCYLFSARNKSSNEFGSFKGLKNYVASCIYAQILGPMQELNNSIEDNVLKSTMTILQKDGLAEFNRYCSAGIRLLIYPYEKIVEYLVTEKILEIFTQQWMEIDGKYKREKEEALKREKEGYYEKILSRSAYYLRYVDMADERSPLIKQIRREVGGEEEKKNWQKYLEELDREIDSSFNGLKKEWEDLLECCQVGIACIKKGQKRKRTNEVKVLEEDVDDLYKKCIEETGKIKVVLKAKFFGLNDNDDVPQWHFLAWLKRENGLIHINSIRYFIYLILEKFAERKNELEERINRERDIEERIRELKEYISKRQIRTNKGYFNYICNEYSKYLEAIEVACKNDMEREIYTIGIETLQGISDSLEHFYDAYRDNREFYCQKREDIFNQITERNDPSVSYVYTEKEQLKKLLMQVTDYEKDKETNSTLSQAIFMKLWKVSEGNKEDVKEKIDELFQKDCFELWERNLKNEYNKELDLNIIEAILREGEGKKGYYGRYNYLDETLRNMWEKTVPYLQFEKVGNEALEKEFCTYNEKFVFENEKINYILEKELYQKGGVDSNGEIDKYRIIFYKAIYNLKAVDIEDFSPGTKSSIKDFNNKLDFNGFPDEAGETFKAYHEIIDIQNITKLSPHIDKRWSNIFEMPDINLEYTKLREKKVYQAFYLMWLDGSLEEINKNGMRYSVPMYEDNREEYPSLKELLKALGDNMSIVKNILDEGTKRIGRESDKGTEFRSSYYGRAIYSEKNTYGQFWLPYQYLCEQQMPKWDKKLINSMIEAIIDTLKILIEHFYGDRDADRILKQIVSEGYKVSFLYKEEWVIGYPAEARKVCEFGIKDICRVKGIDLNV